MLEDLSFKVDRSSKGRFQPYEPFLSQWHLCLNDKYMTPRTSIFLSNDLSAAGYFLHHESITKIQSFDYVIIQP